LRSLRPLVFVPLLLAGLFGCNSTPTPVAATGSVQLAVSARQALASSDVTRVAVTISAPDLSPLTTELFPSQGVWGGVIGDITAGTSRVFLAKAFDASGALRYEGQVEGVTITAGTVTLVTLTLQSTTPSTPYSNEAPVIDSVVAAPTRVAPGGSVSLTASAHDPNAGDTLTFAWSAASGTFGTPSQASTHWTAPATTGPVLLTLTVSDSRGAASSVSLRVLVSVGEGGAAVDVRFNSPPKVTSLTSTQSYVQVGQPTTLSVLATDVDGDPLSYQWSATCPGTFEGAGTATVRFTPSALPAAACNNCQLSVTLSDGRGGTTQGSLALCVAKDTAGHLPPTVVRSYQSSLTATASQQLAFEVVASDTEGSALTFSWAASTGTLGAPSTGTTSSRLTWTAPSCVSGSATPTVTATVQNAFLLTAVKTFSVTGLPSCVTSGWLSTSPMGSVRSSHSATLLPNGKVLVAGGYDGNSTLAKAELYDPASKTWSATGAMLGMRSDHKAVLLPGGKVLVMGGGNNNGTVATAELYDSVSGTWSATGAMSTPRSSHTATLLSSGKVLVTGGGASGVNATAEVYEPSTGTWSLVGSMGSPRFGHAAALLPSGKVLAVGGYVQNGNGSPTEVYDSATRTWSVSGALAEVRIGHTATVLSTGKVLVSGGYNLGQFPAAAEVYDPATQGWSNTSALLQPRYLHTATPLASGKVLVTGGYNWTTLAATELYEPTAGTWSAAGAMSTPRQRHTATLLADGKVLVVGGETLNNSAPTASADLYTP
jgi:N-acetylneuraminic acid mutarotase